MMEEITLVTSNKYKTQEISEIAKPYNIKIIGHDCKIEELQTDNRFNLIKNKVLKAFEEIKIPVIVDHASLEIDSLNGMPGPLTQLFWDRLKGDLCNISMTLGMPTAKAICTIGYCDGKMIHTEEAQVTGKISSSPKGSRKFQWDTIFIPDGQTKTYGEMSVAEKNLISQRQKAFKKLFSSI
ncbi:MAG: non-canonical purine NTP pyrophosphatase [Chitinophagales bacterium]